MKKKVIAAGVIAALGVAWAGSTWYTGRQLEIRIKKMLTEANAETERSPYTTGLELVQQNYQRGVFTSQFDLVVKPVDGVAQIWLKSGQTIVIKESIDHGPFPLAALKSFNPMPVFASVKTMLVNNDVTRPLFDPTNGQPLVGMDTRISYNGNTRTRITLAPLNRETDPGKLSLSGGEFTLNADRDGTAFSLSGSLPTVQFGMINENGMRTQLTLSNLLINGSWFGGLTGYGGSQTVTLDKLDFSSDGGDYGQLEGLKVKCRAGLAEGGRTLNSGIDFTLNRLKLKNQDMGRGTLSLSLNGITGLAWHGFRYIYNANAQEAMPQLTGIADNPEPFLQAQADALRSAWPLLLKAEPELTIAPLSWTNNRGEATFNLSLLLSDPEKLPRPPRTGAELVKKLDARLVIPTTMATGFMEQSAILRGYKPEEAEKRVARQVKDLSATGRMLHLTTEENNSITASLLYTAGQITLNGYKTSPEVFDGISGRVLNLPVPDALSGDAGTSGHE
ncbi:YdgA family protein [Trabulsiella odontotermitis]|uniref:YdgA family protein n=1 Tax=Trabulsiella odontotermitis TaxID=379893 RepID=UPI000676075B|nr:DUF945 family protein [Trabulsiella odontotermitis]KNC92577.1 hypothetical protein GM30_15885 [Trabulsiella odontotermitis]